MIYMCATNSALKPSRRKFRSSCLVSLVLLLSITLAFCLLTLPPATAVTPDELASTYAPVLHFTGGEKFYPTSVDYIISSSVLKQRFSDGSNTTIDAAPTAQSLGTYTGTDLFLDNKNGTLDAIAADYASKASSVGYYAYVHIVTGGSTTVIQYWLFYAYNNGPLNNHQGDIEVVEIFLDASGIPQKALYSQHGAGENAGWGEWRRMIIIRWFTLRRDRMRTTSDLIRVRLVSRMTLWEATASPLNRLI